MEVQCEQCGEWGSIPESKLDEFEVCGACQDEMDEMDAQ